MESKAITVNIPRWETDSLELICGIANAGGGYVLLPTSQKDYSSGLRRTRRKFESIPDSITQDLGLTCPITPVMEGNEFFLEIDVPAAQEPLALHGVYWLYEDGVNTRQTYESISRSWRDEATTPWELKTLPYVEDEDLSGEALVAIAGIPLSNMDATSGTLTDTVKSRLDHLGLTHPRTGKVNNAAAVLLCANPARFVPGATVHIESFEVDGSPAGLEDEVIGPLPQQIDDTVRLIMDTYLPSISTARAFTNACPPESAVREAVTNALLHKDYASGVPVRITVSPQRLVIQNVGAVPAGWTEEDFVREHAPHFRNPVLATAARLLEITPGWGEGVRTMREGCIQAGAELPNFDLSPEHTAVVFPLPATKRGAAAVRAKAGGKARAEGGRDRKATAPQATGDGARRATFAERSLAAAHKLDMTQTDEYVLQVLTTNGRATAVRIAQALGVSERTVRRSFKKLRDYGFIERIGSDKAGYWSVTG